MFVITINISFLSGSLIGHSSLLIRYEGIFKLLSIHHGEFPSSLSPKDPDICRINWPPVRMMIREDWLENFSVTSTIIPFSLIYTFLSLSWYTPVSTITSPPDISHFSTTCYLLSTLNQPSTILLVSLSHIHPHSPTADPTRGRRVLTKHERSSVSEARKKGMESISNHPYIRICLTLTRCAHSPYQTLLWSYPFPQIRHETWGLDQER